MHCWVRKQNSLSPTRTFSRWRKHPIQTYLSFAKQRQNTKNYFELCPEKSPRVPEWGGRRSSSTVAQGNALIQTKGTRIAGSGRIVGYPDITRFSSSVR